MDAPYLDRCNAIYLTNAYDQALFFSYALYTLFEINETAFQITLRPKDTITLQIALKASPRVNGARLLASCCFDATSFFIVDGHREFL